MRVRTHRLGLWACFFLGQSACSADPLVEAAPIEAPVGPLPDPVELHSVDLSMRIDPSAETFSGEARLHIELEERREALWMHGQGLQVSSLRFVPTAAEPIAATWTEVSATGTARVVPEQALPPGDYAIEVAWSAPFATDLSGLFKVEERGNAFVLAKSESIQARRALPGFDEPRFKAPYRVKLTVPSGLTVIGNGAELARTPAEAGFETVTLAETSPLPTYLLSLAVGPFESVDGPSLPATPQRPEPVPVRGHARPGRAADLGATLSVTPRLVEILEDAFGLPFPDPKLDIVAAPAWPSGATELAGAITYREARVLLGPKDDGTLDPATRQRMLSTHAHELVHMWFGNQVTPAWWNDLWLKEGFATWGSALALHTMEPEGGHDLHAAKRKIRAFRVDSFATARSVREPIRGDADIRNAYDSITYGKGMGIIEMVDHGYGADVFRPAVRTWLESEATHATDTASFIQTLHEASGDRSMGSTFATFLDQPGVPLLQVSVDCPNGHPPSVTLRQQRYRPGGSSIRDTLRWTIPVCIGLDGEQAPVCTTLETKDKAIPLPGETCPRLLRPNPGGHGYYRFALSTAKWKTLATALPSLPATEALLTVDSAIAGFEARSIPAPVLLMIFRAAAVHPSHEVVTAPLAGLKAWRRHLPPDDRNALDDWTRATWANAHRRAARDQGPEGRLLAGALLEYDALVLEAPAARSQLQERLEARLRGDASTLTSTAADAALRVIAEDRGADSLRTITGRIVALDDPILEAQALTAAGYLQDPEQRKVAFDEVLTGQLDPRVAFGRVEALMSTHNASRREDIRARIEASWQTLATVIPGQWRRDLPRLWAGSACSREGAQALRTWFDGEAATVADGHERVLAQTIEQIELCDARDWMEKAFSSAF